MLRYSLYMSKHTPGAWKNQGNVIFTASHKHIAKIFTLRRVLGDSTAMEESANAQLIAAAPEMLKSAASSVETMGCTCVFDGEAEDHQDDCAGIDTAKPYWAIIARVEGGKS